MIKKLTCLFVFSLFAFVTFEYGQTASQVSVTNKRGLNAKVDAYIKPYLDIGGFNGTVLIAKDGKVLLSKGYGMANYELNIPNTPQTKFHLASVSKTFTAAAIMMLQERGLLNVSDPLTKFIPDYPNGDKITVHHLLTNTSGIPSINNFPEYDEWSKFPHTPEDLIEKFKNKPLDFSPGTRGYTESNGNYNLLAYIIEKLSGNSYGEFLEENIFAPLNMKDSGHDAHPETILKNRANGYVPDGISELKNAPYLDWTVKIGNASIYSTTEDLYKWDRSLYTEKILKKATIEKMFSEGYGWFDSKRFNRRAIRMNGRSPGFQSEIQRYVDNVICIIVLGNNYAPTASLIAEGLAAIALNEKYEIPKLAKPVKLDPKKFDAYVGRYQFGSDFFVPGGIYAIEKRNDQLFMTTKVINDTLTPQSETEFFDRTFWATIIFVKNDKGEITNLIWRYGGKDYRADRLKDK
jgi:CubicO group peptidase (beta-lactamase class C family)